VSAGQGLHQEQSFFLDKINGKKFWARVFEKIPENVVKLF
jgi:hypothetical protein